METLDITGVARAGPERCSSLNEQRWVVAVTDGTLSTSIEVCLPAAAQAHIPSDEAAWVCDAIQALVRDRRIDEERIRTLVVMAPIQLDPPPRRSLA